MTQHDNTHTFNTHKTHLNTLEKETRKIQKKYMLNKFTLAWVSAFFSMKLN